MPSVSEADEFKLSEIRQNIRMFMERSAGIYDRAGARLLDVAPQDHEGAAPFFRSSEIETLDIDSRSGATYVTDLCIRNNPLLPADRFDLLVCTEVLEHTLQPFHAVSEIGRVLKPGGVGFISTPFNFRIHGPLPDCWRFTEHGLRALFEDFDILELRALEDPDRFLMPTQYTMIVRKPDGAISRKRYNR